MFWESHFASKEIVSEVQFNAAFAPTCFEGTSLGKNFKKKKQFKGLRKRRKLEEIGHVPFVLIG